jgi:predicted 3-demethylubiquinone-9 3-methyltransferase (glyoxalase superfamily)
MHMQKIQTFLWFNDQAEDAATLYASTFRNSKVLSTMPGPSGKPMGLTIEAGGRQFILFNGGPQFHTTPAISFFVNCETPQEVDGVWEQLAAGGSIRMELNQYPWSEKYGWVEDKYECEIGHIAAGADRREVLRISSSDSVGIRK